MQSNAKTIRAITNAVGVPALTFIAWLQLFANNVGDKLPFGDSAQTEISLSFPAKEMVYDICKQFVQNKDVTDESRPICYSFDMENFSRARANSTIKVQAGFFKVQYLFSVGSSLCSSNDFGQERVCNL